MKLRADEAAVPGPVVLGVGRRVDADPAAARADVPLEGRLLGVVEDVTRRQQEDDRVVALPRLASVKVAPSSVASTAKPFFAPRSGTAWIATGIEACLKPAVFVKTRIRGQERLRHAAQGRERQAGRKQRFCPLRALTRACMVALLAVAARVCVPRRHPV